VEHQHDDNVVSVCSDCAPRAGQFTGQDPTSFVGKLVKLAFKSVKPDGVATKEHMWVQVQTVVAEDWLRGKLLNTPYFQTGFEKGNQVGFQINEIEEVMPDPPKVHFLEN